MPLGVIPTPHTVAASATSAVQSDQEHQRKSEAEDGHFAGPFHRDFIDTLIRQKLLPVDVHLFLLSDSGKNDKPADLAKELETARKALAEEQTKVRQLMEERTSILEEAKSAREAVVGADAKCLLVGG